jgi:non-haem Fe2+, alpha-ketoglutarate-dependent halogenase
MGRLLSTAQLQRYVNDGIVLPIRVLTAQEVSRFRCSFEEVEARAGGRLKYAAHLHLYFRWAYDLATHPKVLDAVEDILGPDILVDSTLILSKYPGDVAFVPWHQDGGYSAWHTSPSTSAWIALTDSTADNGCMRVIPGSHRQGRYAHRDSSNANSLVKRATEIEVDVDEAQARDANLRAGELSLHHASIIHGSAPNRSKTKRIGFIIRFVTCQFQIRHSEYPVVRARGDGDCGKLPVLVQPPAGGLEEAFSSWKGAVPGLA